LNQEGKKQMRKAEQCGRLEINGLVGPRCGACERCAFEKLMAAVVSLYPGTSVHEAMFPSYWGELQRFDLDDVRAGFKRAIRESPEFVPKGPQVVAWCEVIERDGARRQRGEQRTLIPGTVTGGATLPDDHAAMELARAFERESLELGLQPDRATPADVAIERCRRIAEVTGLDLGGLARAIEARP